jgi:DNA-binding response OmpR family regulator
VVTTSAGSAPRILLVDDSPFSLACTEDALVEAGFAVHCASDLGSLAGATDGPAFDLVLMDVMMPDAAGDDVAQALRSIRGVDTPILLLSSLDEVELAARARAARLDGYIPKRIGVDGLVVRVREFLASRA